MTTQHRITFDAATERAERGIQQSAEHANAREEGWTFQALGMLTVFAKEADGPFLIEQARAWAESNGLPVPPSEKAWGAVARMAMARRRIEKCGAAPANSSNRSLKHLWRHIA